MASHHRFQAPLRVSLQCFVFTVATVHTSAGHGIIRTSDGDFQPGAGIITYRHSDEWKCNRCGSCLPSEWKRDGGAVTLSHTDSATQRHSLTLTSDLVGPVAWQRRSGLRMLSRRLSGSTEAEGGVASCPGSRHGCRREMLSLCGGAQRCFLLVRVVLLSLEYLVLISTELWRKH